MTATADARRTGARPGRNATFFVFDSWFLTDAYRRLTQDPSEDMVLVTGPTLARGIIRVPCRMLEFEKQRSRYGVKGDPRSVLSVLMELERWGLHPLAALHSHPGSGPDAAEPSNIDREYLANAVRAGYRNHT